jgi:uncharacterized protein
MNRIILACIAVLLLVASPVSSSAQFVEVPALESLVTDKTGVLGPLEPTLEQTLRALKSEKGSEIAVLILPTTKPEEIEQYSIRVVDAWKLGRKGVDDGALLIIALEDRKVRIEVGRGLEGDIPDAKANRIIQEQILPHFRQGDIPAGIQAGTQALVSLVRGMDLPPPVEEPQGTDPGMLVPLIFFFLYIGLSLSSAFGKGIGTAASAVGALGIGWLVTSLLVVAIPYALVCGLLVFFTDPKALTHVRGGGGRYPRGYSGGGFPGGFSSGGGFGGGGSFGGGGASGRW